MLQLCDMQMQRAFQPPPTQHTVNQAAGIAGKAAAAAAAVQPAKALLQDSTLTSGCCSHSIACGHNKQLPVVQFSYHSLTSKDSLQRTCLSAASMLPIWAMAMQGRMQGWATTVQMRRFFYGTTT
jgi:hypothetical protein